MRENIIDKIVNKISINDYPELEQKVEDTLINLDKIYSFIVYVRYDEQDTLCGWSIQYNVSQNDKYNTLLANDVKQQVLQIINDFKKQDEVKYVIGYGQPSANLMLELYDPMICKLSKTLHDKWNKLLYDDICQDCRLIILQLHSKGYYINKRLVEKCLTNYVLQQIKKERDVSFISLDTPIKNEGEDKDMCLSDMVPDTCSLYIQTDSDLEEAHQAIFNEIKQFIIDRYGERAFDQLYRSYANGTTYSYTQNLLWKIKRDLDNTGLLNDLKNRYFQEVYFVIRMSLRV